MATEAALYATFTISRGTSDATDVVFGTLTGPLVFADCEALDSSPDNTRYQVVCEYIAGTDQALEYSIFRKTFVNGAAVEVDTALATLAGASKATFLKKVSDDGNNTTYDIIVLHLNA
jgi:hypothetical protein